MVIKLVNRQKQGQMVIIFVSQHRQGQILPHRFNLEQWVEKDNITDPGFRYWIPKYIGSRRQLQH